MYDPWPWGYVAALASFVFLTLVGHGLAATGIIRVSGAASRIGCLDGLRGYLAVSVACHHFLIWLNYESVGRWLLPESRLFVNFGQSGVALFFMITGTLFYAKVIRSPRRSGWGSLYVGRAFRLVPLLFLVSLTVHLATAAVDHFHLFVSLPRFLYSVVRWASTIGPVDLGPHAETVTDIASVIWSLQYETLFYAALPVLALVSFFVSRMKAAHWVLPGLFLLAAAAAWGLPSAIVRFLPLFALGAVAYELRESPLSARLRSTAAGLAGLIALAVVLFGFDTSYGPMQYGLLLVFFAPVVAGQSYFGILETVGALVLGELSYGIYLWHTAVIAIPVAGLGLVPPFAWFAMPVTLAAVVLVSAVTYVGVERPGIAIGRWLSRGWNGRVDKADAAPEAG